MSELWRLVWRVWHDFQERRFWRAYWRSPLTDEERARAGLPLAGE